MTAFRGSWRARVWRLSWPIMLANLSVPLPGAVDTAVLGHVGNSAAIGAVSLCAAIFMTLFWGFGFLRMGATGLTAQARGSDDPAEARMVLLRGLLLAAVFALLLLLLRQAIAGFAFPLLGAGPDVESLARDYYAIRIWGAPATLGVYVLTGWFLGLGSARIPMLLQFLVNGANILLDLWFLLGLGWGVQGVAAATVAAEYAGLALGLTLAARHLDAGFFTGPAADFLQRLLNGRRLRRMLSLNRDIFLRTLCLNAAFMLFTASGARLGDDILAANAVLLNFLYFTAFGLDGIANAAESLAGEAVGRGDPHALSAAARAALGLGGVAALGIAAVYALTGERIISLFTDLPEVRETARAYLPWVAALPLFSVWSFIYDGLFLGATRGRDLRNMMILSLAGYLALLLLAADPLGNHGLWAAMMLFMILRGLTLWLRWPALLRSVSS